MLTCTFLPFRPRGLGRWEDSYDSSIANFGGPADSGSPVALRPSLTRGLPFRLASKSTMNPRPGQVKERRAIGGISNQLATGVRPKKQIAPSQATRRTRSGRSEERRVGKEGR